MDRVALSLVVMVIVLLGVGAVMMVLNAIQYHHDSVQKNTRLAAFLALSQENPMEARDMPIVLSDEDALKLLQARDGRIVAIPPANFFAHFPPPQPKDWPGYEERKQCGDCAE